MAMRAAELDESLYGPAVATAATGDALAFVAIVLRLLARRIDQQSLWWDDYLVLPSLATTLATSFTSWATFGNNRIPGNDPLLLSPAMMATFLKVFYLYQALGPLARACYKLSILALLLRLFRPNRRFCKVIYVSMGILACWAITFTLVSIFRCRPVQKLWIPPTPGVCVNPTILIASVDISNIALEAGVLGVVAHRVWRLNLFQKQRGRWITMLVLSLILIGSGFAVAYFNAIKLMPFFNGREYSLNGAVLFYLFEINLGIICACLPTLPPIFELCCAPRSRKDRRRSQDSRRSIISERDLKTLELEAEDVRAELDDPRPGTTSGKLRAELLDTKVNRMELHGTTIPTELPTYEMSVEIDGREVSQSYYRPTSDSSASSSSSFDSIQKWKALPAIPPQAGGNFF